MHTGNGDLLNFRISNCVSQLEHIKSVDVQRCCCIAYGDASEQERLRISERTKAGLQRARRAGKVLGRPRVELDVMQLRKLQQNGLSLRQIAAKAGLSLSTVVRAINASA